MAASTGLGTERRCGAGGVEQAVWSRGDDDEWWHYRVAIVHSMIEYIVVVIE